MAYFPSPAANGDSVTLADGTVFTYDGTAWNRSTNAGVADYNARRISVVYAVTPQDANTLYSVNYV